MSDSIKDRTDSNRLGRRDALRLGGMGISIAALVAACGDDRGGETSPGRVGYAPPQTEPPNYPVDDAVLLRTAASVERTIVSTYEWMLETGTLGADESEFVETLIGAHEETAAELDELTTAVGGTPWECTNPWMVDRLVDPVEATIEVSDDPARDMGTFMISLEDMATSTMQMFAGMVEDIDARVGLATGAADTAQQAATAALLVGGPDAAISPDLTGGEGGTPDETDGVPTMYALSTTFGSVAQFESTIGPADENGVRPSFNFATPADNSYIYNELEPSC